MLKFVLKISCAFMLFFCSTAGVFAFETDKNDYAVIGNRKVFLNVADTFEKRAKGLMHIKHLPEYQGMIFLFPNAEPKQFWMKNVEIPLDMIFIRKRKIMTIYKNVPIDKENRHLIYKSIYKSDCVIEVNAGFCDKYNIKKGDLIYLSNGVKYKWERMKTSQNK